MLLIALSWLYIVCLSYIIGVALHALLQRVFHTERTVVHFSLKCLSGLAAITFISMVSCLFMPLDGLFQLVLIIIAAICAIVCRKTLKTARKADWERWQDRRWAVRFLFIVFVLIMAKLSLNMSSHYDDGLYYSTTIKWLQEYGTVKGLANINPRIAFNSSWHILQAVFGFPFLHIGLFNDMNGLLFVLVLSYSMDGIDALLKGRVSLLNTMRALLMLPVLAFHFGASSEIFLFNVNFVESSSADFPACLLTWMVFLLFLEGWDAAMESRNIRLTDILVVAWSAWVVTIKLSCAPILLVSCFILARALVFRQIKAALSMAVMSLLFLVPWIARTALLSGYLFFPFPAIDLLKVPWKLPLVEARNHEIAVKAFALGADVTKPFDTPFSQWFPAWFSGLNLIRKVVLGAAVISFVGYTGITVRYLLSGGRGFLARNQRPVVYVLTGTVGILFWLLKAPDFRFGYGFLCIYDLLFLVLLFRFFPEGYFRYLALAALLYMAPLALIYYRDTWKKPALLFKLPIAYRIPGEIKDVTIPSGQQGKDLPLHLVFHGDSWNAPLPVANDNDFDGIQPAYIGTTIGEGFRSRERNTP